MCHLVGWLAVWLPAPWTCDMDKVIRKIVWDYSYVSGGNVSTVTSVSGINFMSHIRVEAKWRKFPGISARCRKVDHKNWLNDCKVSFNWVSVAIHKWLLSYHRNLWRSSSNIYTQAGQFSKVWFYFKNPKLIHYVLSIMGRLDQKSAQIPSNKTAKFSAWHRVEKNIKMLLSSVDFLRHLNKSDDLTNWLAHAFAPGKTTHTFCPKVSKYNLASIFVRYVCNYCSTQYIIQIKGNGVGLLGSLIKWATF